MTFAPLLDKAKEKLRDDKAIATFLDVSKQHISNVRHGHSTLSEYHAARLAELVGERWFDHALPALAAKAKTPEEAAYWRKKWEGLRRAIVAVALVIGTATASQKVSAAQLELEVTAPNIQCAQSRMGHRRDDIRAGCAR
jgi:predicted transcriptional regulator